MVKPVPSNLAPTLVRLRLAHGFASQAKLAEAVGLAPSTIGNVEAGTRNLGRESCDAVAVVLGLDEKEYAELLEAAGHVEVDGVVSTFASRLDFVEAELRQQRELLNALLDRLPEPPPVSPPRRRAKR